MKQKLFIALVISSSMMLVSSCTGDSAKEETQAPKLKEETVSYTVDSLNMKSFVVYDENLQGKRPAVLVVHEWWGLNDYVKNRARQLAELGYVAMAVDMYGNDRMGSDPKEAESLAMPFYYHPDMAKKHFDAALENFKKNENVDANNIAAMGYCFGGSVVLGMAKMGEDLKGVVSFHGNLAGMAPDKSLLKADILVCHGADDQFVSPAEVDQFKKQMDSIGANYTFKAYPGATHSFTNPQATEWGEKFNMPISYNAAADSASWNDMKVFFGKIFR